MSILNNKHSNTFKIFCGNLSTITRKEDLYEKFCKYGPVVEAVVLFGKGFGFVHMKNKSDGDKAIKELQGTLLNGAKLSIERASNPQKPGSQGFTTRKNCVGFGMSSLDDFENVLESEMQSYAENGKLSQIKNIVSSLDGSPVFYSNDGSIAAATTPELCNSNNGSEKVSPKHSSSTSTPDRFTNVAFLQQQQQQQLLQGRNSNTASPAPEVKSICSQCRLPYDSDKRLPKILSCSHTFCSSCLRTLVNGVHILCPLSCPFITTLSDSGIAGLTTNQTLGVIIKEGQQTSVCATINNINTSVVCCDCYELPAKETCIVGHHVLPETEAPAVIKANLQSLLKRAAKQLKNVNTTRDHLKERMQSTMHSLSKFSEELKKKLEEEEFEGVMQQTYHSDVQDMVEALEQLNNLPALISASEKIQNYAYCIGMQFNKYLAKEAVNNAIDSIVLKLKPELLDTYLSQLGLNILEEFPLSTPLDSNAQNGYFSNVLLSYMLCDLLGTRLGTVPQVQNETYGQHSPSQVAPQSLTKENLYEMNSNSTPSNPSPITSIENNFEAVTNSEVSYEKPTTPTAPATITCDSQVDESSRDTPPIVTSPFLLGFSNLSIPEIKKNVENGDRVQKEEPAECKPEKPLSYSVAVKKSVPTSSTSNSQVNSNSIAIPPIVKKFPHCWMALSLNGISLGKVVFQLRPDQAPKMCQNFADLCTRRNGYGYKGTRFFKNGDGFIVGGDVENDDGSGGYSAYGKEKMEAELCRLKDDVGMVRFKGIGTSDSGRGMIGSQFMIWYSKRDFKKFSYSLVFGKVVSGLEYIEEIANHNLYKVSIRIDDCGAV